MSSIRPLAEDDLPALAALYGELARRDPNLPSPGFTDFFRRTLLAPPLADPEVPSLVCEDEREGVIGFIGSHARPFVCGERRVKLACSGPMIVHPAHRPRGIGALLLRRYLAGPQDMTFNDRMIDEVQAMWARLGGVTDVGASFGWRRVLAPVGAAAAGAAQRTIRRQVPPGGALFARLDALVGRRAAPPRPSEGTVTELAPAQLVELHAGLGQAFALRPDYDAAFVAALYEAMERVDLGGPLVPRLVSSEGGEPLGAYLMHVAPHGAANVLAVAARPLQVGLVLDHLLFEAAALGAVEACGRVEPHTVAALHDRGARFGFGEWSMVQTRDAELEAAVLAGRALLTRFDGEWWMRPRPEL